MTEHNITLNLSPKLMAQARMHANLHDVALPELLRQLLTRELNLYNPVKTRRKDDTFWRFAAAFRNATSWSELLEELRKKGCTLRAKDRRLAIYSAVRGQYICGTNKLGHSYASLQSRLGGPMPGDPETLRWVAPVSNRDDDDFDVIERD